MSSKCPSVPFNGTGARWNQGNRRMIGAMVTTDAPPIGRRIKAAMALAGLTIEDLADRIDQRGLGARTLRKLQDDDDSREARTWELREIAKACDVPEWFLTSSAIPTYETPDTRPADLQAQIDALREDLTALKRRLAGDGLVQLLAQAAAQAAQGTDDTASTSPAPSRQARAR